jgi:AcrR family transcriptional regulator
VADVKDERPRPSRREKARSTRQRIVRSALAAFTTRGYADSTMASIARDADVAVQTVYFAFSTKGDLLQAVYEHVVLGPEGLHPHQSPWWRATEDAPDVATAVRALVEGTVTLLERAAPLVAAVLADPTARAAYDTNEGLRREGNRHLVQVLSEKHPLRDGLTPTTAGDVLLVLTGPQLYTQLTRELGWTPPEVADWMAGAVLRELFGIDTAHTTRAEPSSNGA